MKPLFVPTRPTKPTSTKSTQLGALTKGPRTPFNRPQRPLGLSISGQQQAKTQQVSTPWREPQSAAATEPLSSSFDTQTPAPWKTVILSVNHPSEYVLATQVHVERNALLALALLEHDAQQPVRSFADLTPEFVQRFIRGTHDLSKRETSAAFLEQHHLEEPLAVPLVENWGKRLKFSPYEPNPLIDRLNATDHAVEDLFFAEQQHLFGAETFERVKFQATHLVNVADKVDRGMALLSKYEEMGKEGVRVSEYLANSPKPLDQEVVRLAKWLEDNYDTIIPEGLRLNYFDARDTTPSIVNPDRLEAVVKELDVAAKGEGFEAKRFIARTELKHITTAYNRERSPEARQTIDGITKTLERLGFIVT